MFCTTELGTPLLKAALQWKDYMKNDKENTIGGCFGVVIA